MKGSEAFRAMVGGHKIRRASWPEGCTWAADIEQIGVKPIIEGPPRWIRKFHKCDRWVAHQWTCTDWEVLK